MFNSVKHMKIILQNSSLTYININFYYIIIFSHQVHSYCKPRLCEGV